MNITRGDSGISERWARSSATAMSPRFDGGADHEGLQQRRAGEAMRSTERWLLAECADARIEGRAHKQTTPLDARFHGQQTLPTCASMV